MKNIRYILIFFVALSLLAGCISQRDLSEARETFAETATGEIVIGMAGPTSFIYEFTGFMDGVLLAVEELNRDGGINGRLIAVQIEDDQGTFENGIRVAQELASREEVVAVVGHWNSFITLPAARIYNDAGLLMLSPFVSNPRLTQKDYPYVFQNIINDHEMGRRMAAYAKKKGFERMVILYAEGDYGRGLADAFEAYFVKDYGGIVVDRSTAFVNEQEFNRAYARWKAFGYDGVFIADTMPYAASFIKMVREKDPQIPIFGGDGLDAADLAATLGDAAEGLVFATMLAPDQNNHRLAAFVRAYQDKYDGVPDIWAMQGYDSINLLAFALREAALPTATEMAVVLLTQTEWQGVLGKGHFNAAGELAGRDIYLKTVRDGEIGYLAD